MIKKSIKKIVFASAIIAINMACKYLLQFLPNVKPTTSLIILTSMFMGLDVGLFVVVGISVISGLLFGFGTFFPFQLFAWGSIAIFSYIFREILMKNKILFLIIATLSGFYYGIVVSLDMLVLYGFGAFLAYYLNGLLFDLLHAIGNVVFSAILFTVFTNLNKQKFFKEFML